MLLSTFDVKILIHLVKMEFPFRTQYQYKCTLRKNAVFWEKSVPLLWTLQEWTWEALPSPQVHHASSTFTHIHTLLFVLPRPNACLLLQLYHLYKFHSDCAPTDRKPAIVNWILKVSNQKTLRSFKPPSKASISMTWLITPCFNSKIWLLLVQRLSIPGHN